MLYMLLIHENEAEAAGRSRLEEESITRDHAELTAQLERAGTYRGCAAFEPTTTATTVRVRTGRTLVTDGPFGQTREQLGGWYLVDARDLDEAIAIAARVPAARNGSVEVRPVKAVNR